MSLFRRIVEFISYPSHSRTMGLLALLIVLLAIPLTVNIAQKQQEIRQHAAEPCDPTTEVAVTCDPVCTPQNCGQPTICTTSCGRTGVPTQCGPCQPGSTPAPTPPTSPPQTPAGTTTGCERNNIGAMCIDQATYQSTWAGKGTIISDSCWSGDQVCFKSFPDCTNQCVQELTGDYVGVDGFKCPGALICAKRTTSTPTPNVCPGQGFPETPGGSVWGGTCVTEGQDFYALTQTQGQCYYVRCERYNNGPLCWYNSGVTTGTISCPSSVTPVPPGGAPTSPASAAPTTDTCTPNQGLCQFKTIQDCNATNAPKQCATATNLNCSNNNPCMKIFPSTAAVPPSSAPASPVSCPASTTCQPQANTCNDQGVQTTYTGPNCTMNPNQPCSPVANRNNCSSGNVCPTSGTGTCVAQAQPPGTGQTGNTQISFAIGLDGIGNTGDQKSQGNSSGSTKNPRTSSKSFSIEILDNNNNVVKTVGSGLLTSTTAPRLNYNSSSGKYEGSVFVDLTAGTTYSVKIQGDRYLKRRLGSITGGQPNVLSGNLVTGAMAGNNFLSAADYGNLLGCLFKPLQATITFCNLADLDDNGVVDQFDYNLFLREISVVQNGD